MDQPDPPLNFGNAGLRCGRQDNYRDVFMQGDCDASVRAVCGALGWADDLEAIYRRLQAAEAAAAWEALVQMQPLGELLGPFLDGGRAASPAPPDASAPELKPAAAGRAEVPSSPPSAPSLQRDLSQEGKQLLALALDD